MASSVFLGLSGVIQGNVTITGNETVQGVVLAADGTAAAPSYSFASQPGTGIYNAGTNEVRISNTTTLGYQFKTTGLQFTDATSNLILGSNGDTIIARGAAGRVNIANTSSAIGSSIKVDALPTVASGFGTSPAIIAGSTPFAGAINVGTGVPGTGGVINFNGTAFPSAPFIVCMNQTSLMVVRATATTTQLTLAATALTAGDVISWIAVSSK